MVSFKVGAFYLVVDAVRPSRQVAIISGDQWRRLALVGKKGQNAELHSFHHRNRTIVPFFGLRVRFGRNFIFWRTP
jgi:hypothetical protein